MKIAVYYEQTERINGTFPLFHQQSKRIRIQTDSETFIAISTTHIK